MKHLNLEMASAQRQLRTSAIKAGILETDIRELLWLINAHDQLIAFARICENLSEILDLLQGCLLIDLHAHGIAKWPEITRWVVDNQAELASQIGPQFNEAPAGVHPVLGRGATRYGLYAALWNRHENTEKYEHFSLVVGHLLLAHIQYMRNEVPMERYEGDVAQPTSYLNPSYPAARAIRVLSISENEFALALLNPYNEPQRWAKILANRVCSSKELGGSDNLASNLNNYSNFVAKVYGEKSWTGGTGGGGGGKRPWQPGYVDVLTGQENVPADIGDTGDPYNDWGEQETIREIIEENTTVDKKRIDELLRLDVDPAELAGEDELYLVKHRCEESKRGLAGLAIAARGQVRHIVMQNQMLPWHYRELTMTEISRLLAELSNRMRELKRKTSWSPSDQLTAESIALVHVSLWTGSTLARAKSLRVFSGTKPPNCELSLYLPQDDAAHGENRIVEWIVRSYCPQYQTRIVAPAGIVRTRTQYVYLPDIAGGADFLLQLRRRAGGKRQPALPFGRPLKDYKGAVRHLFKTLDDSGRTTERKLESFLFHRIASIHGDVTEAVALTGQGHALAQVRAFYATPSIDHLRNVYKSAVETIQQQVYAASGIEHAVARSAVPEAGQKHVGSRLCARFESVTKAVSNLQKELKQTAHFLTFEDFISYHNLFTLYTVVMFGYSTSCRAIVTPFIPSKNIDPVTHLTSLADKDGPDHHKARLVWLPPDSFHQIQHYEAHCDAFLSSYRHLLKVPRRLTSVPVCFFIEETNHLVSEVRPKTLEPRLREFLNLPANSHRRFMRTELRERGCSTETVDAFMGHWARGEEPWGKFSSFSYSHYVQELQETLLPLLNDLGWRAIASSLVKG
ncbi:MAG: hypothetical protein CL583_03465 [Alteromonadaceae bacterium]|nr:hypothetical protein [Alteromonadaceae bacterium]|tara:strand:+ start:3522 stop:6086 length:2565 start_codon:yes stop_codon:yes gene_type:complete